MCSECPFRAKAPPGWLGPWTVDQLEGAIHAHGVCTFVCHLDIAARKKRKQSDSVIDRLGDHCVGFLRYMTAVFKLSRDSEQAAAQSRLEAIPDQPVIAPFKLRDHHENGLGRLAKRKR